MILNELYNQGKRIFFFFSPQYVSTAMKLYVLKIMANLECIAQMRSKFRLPRKLYFFTLYMYAVKIILFLEHIFSPSL